MVFDSKNETGNLTALVFVPAQDGRPIVVTIDTNFRAGSLEVSRIATIHGKDHPEALMSWIKEGYLR